MTTIDLATLRLLLTADNSKLKPQIEESKGVVSRFGQVAETVLGVSIVGAFQQAGAAAVRFAQESSAEFKQFQGGITEVYSLLPGISAAAMQGMKADVLDFGVSVGRTTDETVPALYQAISAGVPKENAFEFLKIASDAARGGVTTLETAVNGITSVVNAYGADVIDAAQASDLMFTAVKGGKTTFDELSHSLFNVIPTASATGVEFGNITAAISAMTAAGVPTSVATTQLRQLLVELSKEGSNTAETFERVAGQSFREFIASGGNLQSALQLLEAEAQKTGGSISDFFGSTEAGSAALLLTGQGTAKFTTELNNAATAAGSTSAAAKTMGDTAAASDAKIAALTEQFKIFVGEALQPAVTAFNDFKVVALEALIPIAKMMGTTYKDSTNIAAEATVQLGQSAESPAEAFAKLEEAMGIAESNGGIWLLTSRQLFQAHEDLKGKTAELIATTFDFSAHQERVTSLIEAGATGPAQMANAYKQLEQELQATYGKGVTVEDGIISLNGTVIGSIADLSKMAEATDTVSKAQESAAADIKFFTQAAEGQKAAIDHHFVATNRVSDAEEELADKRAQSNNQLSENEGLIFRANAANAQYFESQKRIKQGAEEYAASQAAATEQTRLASLAMSEAAAQARTGYFNAAVEASDQTGLFTVAIDNLGTHLISVGGRTKQQSEDLGQLQDAYDKAAGIVHDYQIGLKGLGMSEDERNAKIQEQLDTMGALQGAMQPLIDITGELTQVNNTATISQDYVKQAMYDAAVAAGVSADALAVMRVELGLATEEQAVTQLATANFGAALDVLAGQLKAGTLSQAEYEEKVRLLTLSLIPAAQAQYDAAEAADANKAAQAPLTDGMNNSALAAENLANKLGNLPTNIEIGVHTNYTESGQPPNVPGGAFGPDNNKVGPGAPAGGNAGAFSVAPPPRTGGTGGGDFVTINIINQFPLNLGAGAKEIAEQVSRKIANDIRGRAVSGGGRK